MPTMKMKTLAALGAGAALLASMAAGQAPRTLPPGTTITITGVLTFRERIDGVLDTVKCTSLTASATVPANPTTALMHLTAPVVTGCRRANGTHLPGTFTGSGVWSLKATSTPDSLGYVMRLRVPPGGATFTPSLSWGIGSCTIIWGAANVGGTYFHDGAQAVEWLPTVGSQTTVGTGVSDPAGIAVDGSGDVFIADYGNNQVVEVPPTGPQTTVPVTGLTDAYAVAVDASGDVFVADYSGNQVVEWNPTTSTQTTVPLTGLNTPTAVAVDGSGDVFVTDYGNNRVVEWNPSTSTQTTVPLTGLSSPIGVAVDSAGDVFAAEYGNAQVVEWNLSASTQTTVPVTGLTDPVGVAVDSVGNVFIADSGQPDYDTSTTPIPATASPASCVVGPVTPVMAVTFAPNPGALPPWG